MVIYLNLPSLSITLWVSFIQAPFETMLNKLFINPRTYLKSSSSSSRKKNIIMKEIFNVGERLLMFDLLWQHSNKWILYHKTLHTCIIFYVCGVCWIKILHDDDDDNDRKERATTLKENLANFLRHSTYSKRTLASSS